MTVPNTPFSEFTPFSESAQTDDPGNVSKPERNNSWIIIAVTGVLIGVIIVGAIGAVYIYQRRNNSLYSAMNVTNNTCNNTIVNIYQDCNVQIGDKNTQNVHQFVSENESASSTDE